MSVFDQLMEMGFDKDVATKASKAADTLDGAVDWILNNPEKSIESEANSATGSEQNPPQQEVSSQVVASFKCDDCGKIFRNEDEVMFHASKTKHENFSESSDEVKPLTAEEKEAKVLLLREKIRLNQAKKAKQEAEEQREKERRRRDEGKAMVARKEEFRDREIREAAEKLRREKVETDAAKKRVLEQIRLDREARQNRAAGKSAEPPKPETAQPIKLATSSKDYDTTTIQIRLLNGQAVRQQFKSKEPLAMVRAWVDTNHSNGASYKMMTPFPRKVFEEEDMLMPLNKLDLVPSANIVLTPHSVM